MMKLNAKQLRSHQSSDVSRQTKEKLNKNEIYIILDNVLDTYNIGAVFRLADAVAAKKIYLCGRTSTPPDPRIKKSSINTTEWVDWEYAETAVEAIEKVRSLVATAPRDDKSRLEIVRDLSKVQVVAIEQAEGSVPYNKYDYSFPVALVVGHESYGVSKETLKECDAVVELPMYGVNVSLNVMVSLGILLYHVLSKVDTSV